MVGSDQGEIFRRNGSCRSLPRMSGWRRSKRMDARRSFNAPSATRGLVVPVALKTYRRRKAILSGTRIDALEGRRQIAGFGCSTHITHLRFLPFADGRCRHGHLLAENGPAKLTSALKWTRMWVDAGRTQQPRVPSRKRVTHRLLPRKEFAALDATCRQGRVMWIGKSSFHCCEAAGVRLSSSMKAENSGGSGLPQRAIFAQRSDSPTECFPCNRLASGKNLSSRMEPSHYWQETAIFP